MEGVGPPLPNPIVAVPLSPSRTLDGMARQRAHEGRLADQRPPARGRATTHDRRRENMKRALFIPAVAACALVALAAVAASAHATYPGATNGRIAFGMRVDGNVDVYTVRPGGQDLRRLTDD